VARTLLEEGARVVATSRNRSEELGALGPELVRVPADLMDPRAPAVRTCRAAIPAMLERGGEAIVNILSVHGRQPSAVNVDYGAAKAAMINLTKALSEEFGPQGIRVNGVCPGPVRTPWWTDEGGAADILAQATGSDREGVMTTVAPEMMQLTTGRLAEPQEIADAVAFLASPHAASTTGTEVVVDSGMMKT
jgi:NAD(P)-dependent dehydrogenase (short-subunit alcohol dehydrogenase family)